MKGLKNKQVLQVLAIVGIIIVSIILFLFPKLIDYRYEYSYENIKLGKEQVEALNDQLISNEMIILSKLSELEDMENKKSEAIRKKSQIGINDSDFVLDMPSILISLEQNAVKNKLELTIDYNAIVTHHGTSQSPQDDLPDYHDDIANLEGEVNTNSLEDEAEDIVEDVEENPEQVEEDEITITEENGEEGEENEEVLIASVPNIEGIDITAIPISVKGSYSKIRDYLKYLDEVGMIEPSSIKLESEGNEVITSVVLNVFHGKEGQ